MLGGRLTAEAAGISAPYQDEIYARITAIPEGELFRADSLLGADVHLSESFTLLRNYDYLHVADGWLVGVVETKHLRRSPYLPKVIASYESIMNCTLTPTGDRIAWERGLRQWEPLQGYRYYTDGESRLLTIGNLKIRTLKAPEWLRDTSPEGELLRIFYDTPEKEIAEIVAKTKLDRQVSQEDLDAVFDLASSISVSNDFEDPSCEYGDPLKVILTVQSHMASKNERQK